MDLDAMYVLEAASAARRTAQLHVYLPSLGETDNRTGHQETTSVIDWS
jgi:hypothetical protein